VVCGEWLCACSFSGEAVTSRVAIIAALPREVAGLVRGWPEQREHGVFVWSSAEAVVVAAGMGEARATLAVGAAVAMGPVAELISVGLAGACDPAIAVGAVMEAAEVIDVCSGEHFATASQGSGALVTGSAIASVREKARLFEAYGAAAVDMEAATVARLALARGIPFRAIKAISDDYAFELASLGKFETKYGHFDTAGFALHTALRPHTWGQAVRLGRHSKLALDALTARLKGLVRG
jgi:adenosylhomocysteine nucleosidase